MTYDKSVIVPRVSKSSLLSIVLDEAEEIQSYILQTVKSQYVRIELFIDRCMGQIW
jgi:hypothetical protein